jgi:hypothetical protein
VIQSSRRIHLRSAPFELRTGGCEVNSQKG